MANPILQTVAEVANRERKKAIRRGDDVAAVVAALVQTWAQNLDKEGGRQSPA